MDKIASIIRDALTRHKRRFAEDAEDDADDSAPEPTDEAISAPKEMPRDDAAAPEEPPTDEPAPEEAAPPQEAPQDAAPEAPSEETAPAPTAPAAPEGGTENKPDVNNGLLPPNATKEDVKNAIIERVYKKLQERLETAIQNQGEEPKPDEGEGEEEQQGGQRGMRGPRMHYHNPNQTMKGPKAPTVPKMDSAGGGSPHHANLSVRANGRGLTAAGDELSLDTEVTHENFDDVMKAIGESQKRIQKLDDSEEPEVDDTDGDDEPNEPKSRRKKKKIDEIEHDTLKVIHNLTEMVKMLVENFPPSKKASYTAPSKAYNFVANDEIRRLVAKRLSAHGGELVFDNKEQEKEYRKQHEIRPDTKVKIENPDEETQKEEAPEQGGPKKDSPKQEKKSPPKNTPDVDAAEDAFLGLSKEEGEKVYESLGGEKAEKENPEEFKKKLVDWHGKSKNPATSEAPKQEAPSASPKAPVKKNKDLIHKIPSQNTPKEQAAEDAFINLSSEEGEKVFKELGGDTDPVNFKKKLVDWVKKNPRDKAPAEKPAAEPKKEEPKQEAPKPETKEAPKEEKSEKPSSHTRPTWFKDDEPLDGNNEEEMKSRGFTKKKAKLTEDTIVVDVTTGEEHKLGELPEGVQEAFREMNSEHGVWFTPSEGGGEGEKSEHGEKPKKESPKKEESKPAEKKEPEPEEKPAEEKEPEVETEDEPEEESTSSKSKIKRRITKLDKMRDSYKNPTQYAFDRNIAENLENDDAYEKYSAMSEKERHNLLNDIIVDSGEEKPTIEELIKQLNKKFKSSSPKGWGSVQRWPNRDSGKAAGVIKNLTARLTLQQRLAEKIAADVVSRKDKDLMQDTGGSSKKRPNAPSLKPSRTDLKNTVREKSKTKEEKDSDIEGDTDIKKD